MKLLEEGAKKNTKPNVRAFSQMNGTWSSEIRAATQQFAY